MEMWKQYGSKKPKPTASTAYVVRTESLSLTTHGNRKTTDVFNAIQCPINAKTSSPLLWNQFLATLE